MEIIGIGNDLIEIERIRESVERFGDRFLKRIFLPQEVAYAQKQADPLPHFAARFAAKEAIAKAMGTGIGRSLKWTDIEITKDKNGKPHAVIKKQTDITLLITLSHTKQHALATALATRTS